MNTKVHSTRKKFAFIRPASYPIPNQILPGVLGKSFPEFDLEIIDIKSILKSHPFVFLRNVLSVGIEYGPKILAGHIKLREALFTTTFINKAIGKMVEKKVKNGDYAFTFQIQSLFDASTSLVPHFVYTDHTHLARLTYQNFDQRKLRSKRWLDIERGLYNHASVIFTRSSNISKSLCEQYAIAETKIVLAGVGSNASIDDLPMENDQYQNKKILFVGIDWERKGGPDLFQAFSILLKKHPDAHLTIVGCSPENVPPNCTIAGKVPVSEMDNYFRKASIFCLPTKIEPFGVVFVEALYHKLPIVATNIGAIPDLVKDGHNGFLTEAGDVEALVQSLDDLLSDSNKCRAFGENGFALAKTNYSWDIVAERMSATIRKFIF